MEEGAPRPSIAGVIKTPLSKEFLTDENIDTYNEFFDSDIRKIQDKETYFKLWFKDAFPEANTDEKIAQLISSMRHRTFDYAK